MKLYFISGLIAVLPIKLYYKRQKELKLISSLFRSLLKLEPVYTLHVIDLCGFINDICPRQAALNQESQYETLSKTVHKVTEFSCQEMGGAELLQELLKEEYSLILCQL